MKKILATLGLALCIVGLSHAGTWSWSNTGEMGSYVPESGYFSEWWGSGYYVSKVDFTLSSRNLVSIQTYNQGYGQGGKCYGKHAYLTADITAVPDAWDLKFDVRAIATNIPNPKVDLESDIGSDNDHEESEVVMLGTASSTSYYTRSYWYDKREGGSNDGGNIQVQFAMSNKGLFDYNNCTTANGIQIINRYGKNYRDQ
jgi:hypothetical protein